MTLLTAIRVLTHRKNMLAMLEVGKAARSVIESEIEAMELLIETAEEKLRRTE